MTRPGSDQFYTDLPLHDIPASQLFEREQYFQIVPEDWFVIVTDIRNSTRAVNRGFHQIVNLIASGSIIAVLNIGLSKGIQVPFFFGGDGAILLVPPSILDSSLQALYQHRDNTARNFQLYLRVGEVPVREIYQRGYRLRLAKIFLGEEMAIPFALGNGLQYAEKVIKNQPIVSEELTEKDAPLDLEGMQCRWQLVKPPRDKPEVVCLLVVVPDVERQAAIFAEVLRAIDHIYGSQEDRNPISIPGLKLKFSPARILDEMRVRLGRFNLSYLIKNFLYTIYGPVFFRFYATGKNYLHQMVALSDILVIDGRISTVISGNSRQRMALTDVLEKLEREKKLLFGMHLSRESVISCYVRDWKDKHIHFVDGSQGGYTQAAKMLKGKLENIQASQL